MTIATQRTRTLRSAFEARQQDWTFADRPRRQHAHGLLSYPAMMIPEMMGEVLDRLSTWNADLIDVYDPFAGSGTVLTECMLRGLNFTGTDINPLAVLSCRVKAAPCDADAIKQYMPIVLSRTVTFDKRLALPDFDGREKWFETSVAHALTTIVRAIRDVDHIEMRRLLWLVLAGVARSTCNSRSTTYKLHKLPDEAMRPTGAAALLLFRQRAEEMIARLQHFWALVKANGHVRRGRYRGDVRMYCHDVRNRLPRENGFADLMITSPPYGDNTTTIPYGQYSYLPLRWLDLADIGDDVSVSTVTSAYAIDRQSLGGSLRGGDEYCDVLAEMSKTFKRVHAGLRNCPRDRRLRLASFCFDMLKSISQIVPRVKSGGCLLWVVGDRRIGGRSIQLSSIISDMLEANGCSQQLEFRRKIPSKRMAMRNSIGATMQEEIILGFRKH